MELRYDLLPKSDRQKIRAAMIDEMKRTLATDRIGYTPAQINAAAIKLTDLALSRERAKQAKETPHVN